MTKPRVCSSVNKSFAACIGKSLASQTQPIMWVSRVPLGGQKNIVLAVGSRFS